MAALLLLLLLLLLLALSFLNPQSSTLFNLCEGTNSTTAAAFLSNLNLLLDYFPSANATFSTQSYGSGPGKIYGLALCRGDVDLPKCSTCLSSATALYITQSCPNNTEASVWLDNCQLCYSDTLFFTLVDTNGRVLVNVANATEVDKFSELKTELLQKLVVAAYNSLIMYATGMAEGRGLPEIYGLVQHVLDPELQHVLDPDY